MQQDRSRSGRAPSATRVGPLNTVAVAVLFGVALSSTTHAQFPPPARPPKVAPAPAAQKPAGDLPSARSVLDRHLTAIGGRQAVLSHKSAYVKGTLTTPAAGIDGTLEVFGAAPNKSLLKLSIGGVGEVVEGFDGVHGWGLSPMTGPMLLEGKQLEDRRYEAEFHSELRPDSRYSSMTTVEQTDFDGRQCYKVRLVRKNGSEETEFYDVQTGLKAGSVTSRETPMGTMTATVTVKEYRKFGNLLQAATILQKVGPMDQIIKIDTFEYDAVPASVFDPPLEIKALLKK
jgi:hypothetical protein